jgi:CBS domain-containing protein
MESALLVPSRTRSATSLLERTVANGDGYLQANDSAFCALTDFHCEYPITVEVDSSVDDSLAHMNRLGVHALLVTQREIESTDEQVLGLITYYDIERWRPHRTPQAAVSKKTRGARVGDIMTPWDELSLVHYDSLEALTALELFDMFQGSGLTHLLVVDMQDDDSALARGLISRGSLAKRLRRPDRTANS